MHSWEPFKERHKIGDKVHTAYQINTPTMSITQTFFTGKKH